MREGNAMLWLLFLFVPIALAIFIAMSNVTAKSSFLLITILSIIFVESLAVVIVLHTWRIEDVVSIVFFGVLAPWANVMALGRIIPRKTTRGVVALMLTFAYAVTLVLCLAVADMLGLLRH
jgi:hypothetical protein